MDHLKHLLEGARRVLVLGDARDYVRPRAGFARDHARLCGDAGRVGADLKRTLDQHGQQVHHGKG